MSTEYVAGPGGEPVVIVDYDPSWPSRFARWRDRLVTALGDVAVAIEHVGSTAVPGLASKPVIDIQVSVVDVGDEAAYRAAIEGLGLVLHVREPDRRFFRADVAAGRPRQVHIHVCSEGSRWERDHLAFRDYLRVHPERRDAYAELKRSLAERFRDDRVGYTDGKDAFVAESLALAVRERSGP